MATKTMDRWLKELHQGTFTLSAIKKMDKLRLEEMTERLKAEFPHRMLERQLTTFQEVGLAQSQRVTNGNQKAKRNNRTSQTYHHCVFLTSDSDVVTGVTFLNKLRCRELSENAGMFEIVSGSGVSFFRDLAEWSIKIMDEKTVTLTKDIMRKRGWLFPAA